MAEHLGAPEEVVVVDETGFPKKGARSAGAGSTAARRARLATARWGASWPTSRPPGPRAAGRELYLPEDWTNDGARLQGVGLVPDTPFATKPHLAGACWNGCAPPGCRWLG